MKAVQVDRPENVGQVDHHQIEAREELDLATRDCCCDAELFRCGNEVLLQHLRGHHTRSIEAAGLHKLQGLFLFFGRAVVVGHRSPTASPSATMAEINCSSDK